MNPPTMMLAPAGIIATASSTETAFMMELRSSGDQEKATVRKVGGATAALPYMYPPEGDSVELNQRSSDGPT